MTIKRKIWRQFQRNFPSGKVKVNQIISVFKKTRRSNFITNFLYFIIVLIPLRKSILRPHVLTSNFYENKNLAQHIFSLRKCYKTFEFFKDIFLGYITKCRENILDLRSSLGNNMVTPPILNNVKIVSTTFS